MFIVGYVAGNILVWIKNVIYEIWRSCHSQRNMANRSIAWGFHVSWELFTVNKGIFVCSYQVRAVSTHTRFEESQVHQVPSGCFRPFRNAPLFRTCSYDILISD